MILWLIYRHFRIYPKSKNMFVMVQYYYKMNRQYYNLYRTKTLNHTHLKQKILQLYAQDPQDLPMNLDQILYYQDLKCEERKADRDISVELFNQTANNIHKATFEALVTKYIQNLQTSQLCLKRDEMRLAQLLNQIDKVEIRKKSFIFLKIIQVSIYSKFTKSSVIQYKIMPTDIPPVTLANAINPILNHQFILQMEQPSFDLIFEESGIEIYRWTFPDQPHLQEGQYDRVITSQNIAFQVKIRYLPEGNTKGRQNLSEQIQKLKIQIDRQQEVFRKLCNYEPFLEQKVIYHSQQQEEQQGDFHLFLKCFPFLKKHIGLCFWLTTLLTVLQCWSASIWPMQFLDIILCIYLIGILLDVQIKDYSMRLLVLQLSIALLSLKSLWGLVTQPFFNKSQTNKYSIILCISLKILLIFGLSIVRGRQYEIQKQKMEFVFGQQPKEQKKEVQHKLQLNIWDEL